LQARQQRFFSTDGSPRLRSQRPHSGTSMPSGAVHPNTAAVDPGFRRESKRGAELNRLKVSDH
jgi:hypothetical protein